VAAAVIVDGRGRVLLARRPDHAHQGGLWEFPGGKLEPGEAVEAGLARELEEELDIVPTEARPQIRVHHSYPTRDVLLDVWRVEAWRGEPHGREGQPVEWVATDELPARAFPAANLPVVSAARLPPLYLVTPEPAGERELLEGLERSLAAGVRLVQLRAKTLPADRYGRLAAEASALCREAGAGLLLNAEPALAAALPGAGVHLPAARLLASPERPLGPGRWVAASCHDLEEVAHACRIGVDFVVVSPVRRTASHPTARPIGWHGLWRITERATVPVYALGGLGRDDLPRAWAHGAQGVAAIRGLWG
jgi:8-oxo-dGTP diphosphatase